MKFIYKISIIIDINFNAESKMLYFSVIDAGTGIIKDYYF